MILMRLRISCLVMEMMIVCFFGVFMSFFVRLLIFSGWCIC